VHSTNNLDDDYFGSGYALKLALKKYGKENFKKEILEWFDWKCEALQREAEIVNEEFIKRNDVYNLKTGGDQCISYSVETINKFKSSATGKKYSEETNKKKGLSGCKNKFFGRKHTDETVLRISLKQSRKYKGKGNPRARLCIVNNIEFDTISDAAKYLNISYPTMLSRLKSDKYTSINYLS
jgi:group I intron endonuclease